MCFCASIQPKLNELRKNCHKTVIFYIDFLDFMRFLKFVQFGLNISAETLQGIDPCALPVLLTPLAPLGACPYRFE